VKSKTFCVVNSQLYNWGTGCKAGIKNRTIDLQARRGKKARGKEGRRVGGGRVGGGRVREVHKKFVWTVPISGHNIAIFVRPMYKTKMARKISQEVSCHRSSANAPHAMGERGGGRGGGR
jgi:hypothetical protein